MSHRSSAGTHKGVPRRSKVARALLIVFISVALWFLPAEAQQQPSVANVEALAVIGSNPSGVSGTVRFVKGCGCTVLARVRLAGLVPGSRHGLHIHELGDMATAGCDSTGAHWNPTSAQHGPPDGQSSHAGDLGNIEADAEGRAEIVVRNPTLGRFGPAALYGRAVVVHNLTDDLGTGGNAASLANGQSGVRIACAVIGRTNVTIDAQKCPQWSAPLAASGSNAAADLVRGVAAFGGSGAVSGSLAFTAGNDCAITASGRVGGLRPNARLGFHLHDLGDLSGGCATAGTHWNPTSSTHGAPDATPSHAGDLGNIETDASGYATVSVSSHLLGVQGTSALLGRAIVIHNGTDDLGLGGDAGSRSTGNSGARIACAIVGRANRGVDGPCASAYGAGRK